MSVRITQTSLMNEIIRSSQARNQEIADLQRQLATGLRVSKPSDDPGTFGTLSQRKASDARMDVNLSNISSARLKLNSSVASLIDASELLEQAGKEIAISSVQSQNREILAQQVDALIEQLVAISNHQEGGLRLFAGAASTTPAFEVVSRDADGRPTDVRYTGSALRSEVAVAPQQTVATLYAGTEIFQATERGTTQYMGTTGARAGTGTDSASGMGELVVSHTLTTYSDPQVSAGVSSAAEDTIVGPPGTHTLSIEIHPERGHVVRLNHGGAIPFNSSSTDLQVFGPQGESVFVDLSGVAPSFTGSIGIVADGTISVDGGITTQAIDFSANQTLFHGMTGASTNVDTTGVIKTGVDKIDYLGTADAFQALFQLRDFLRAADDMTTTEIEFQAGNRQRDLERVQTQILSIVGEQSVDLQNLDSLELRTQELKLSTVEAIGELENADLPKVILEMQSEQNLLRFIYASAASAFDNSILPFIQ